MRTLTTLLAVALALSGTAAFAATTSQEVTPDGSGDYLWNNSDNWTAGLPSTSNFAEIAGSTTITLKGRASTLFSGNSGGGGVVGDLVVASGGTLNLTGTSLYQDVYVNGGTLTVEGTMDCTSQDRQIYLNGGTLAVNAGSLTNSGGRFGLFTNGASAGTVELTGAYGIHINDEAVFLNGTLKYAGNASTLGTLYIHKLNIDPTTTLDLSGLTGLAQDQVVILMSNGDISGMSTFKYDGQNTATWYSNNDETDSDWRFDFNGGNGGAGIGFDQYYLTARYLVPEPVTMSLLAVGGVALLRRRRRS